MAIFGVLNTSGTAMNAHSVHMNQISTNIANLNTTSYKDIETHYQTLKNRVGPLGNFFGVKTAEIRRVEEQGLVAPTARYLDVAINGAGFFVLNTAVDGSGEQKYTRDGSFTGEVYVRGGDTNGDGLPDQGTHLVTRSGVYVMGYKAAEDGTFSNTMSAIDYSNEAIDPGRATSKVELRGNVPATELQKITYRLNVPVIQQITSPEGVPQTVMHGVRLAFTPRDAVPGGWTLVPSGDAGIASVTTTPDEIKFTGEGKLDVAASGGGITTLTITYDGGQTQDVAVDLRQMTQFSGGDDLELRQLIQDGYTASVMRDVYFNSEGVMLGRFSNGVEKPLYKLPIATFPAPQKLDLQNNNIYAATEDAGKPTIKSLSPDDRISEFVGSALEYSNVRLEDQFSRMIITQRAYSSAATVFRTGDEMAKTIRDMF
ncbi:flagellar hook-basal body complex protein [Haematospirillum sp. H1815]|uniref:flagellar hook protein FlgE n=1 Tax=Haematospirillum sp. H1815 TaxID=2723108 RepID=UPI00143BC5D7|nr:flagellar hook-basal body complex protein [Haematospirillum sp. H1815]NKD77116.1 flagellar hook-basal body complex protein [Haematospirillum sp. H1815]